MTDSELFAVMCGGLASVAGSVLAGYASMGVKMEYLIAASFMAAPGGLLFAKLLVEAHFPPRRLFGPQYGIADEAPIDEAEQFEEAGVLDPAAPRRAQSGGVGDAVARTDAEGGRIGKAVVDVVAQRG